MNNKLAIIGIDSLDPNVLLKYKKDLPIFSRLIKESPTIKAKSVFPVDTIPAWMSVFTGLNPLNHGLIYVYDIFDPGLGELNKIDTSCINGKTFWDYSSADHKRNCIIFPVLVYPGWDINGIIVTKSPFEKRINWINTKTNIAVNPNQIKTKYKIQDNIPGIWGGFPGEKNLKQWAEAGKEALQNEKEIGLNLFENEEWDLYFIYLSLLDIIQHRLWRYFDENDPIYCKNDLSNIILDYYKLLDKYIGEFIEARPDVKLIIMSDHGHKSRPYKTININEHLRREGFLYSKTINKSFVSYFRTAVLETANKLNVEHLLIKFVIKNDILTKVSKSIYSSTGALDKKSSTAYLSNFAGIKSYAHGGIEINKTKLQFVNYEEIRERIIDSLFTLKLENGDNPFKWIKKREQLYKGKFIKELYPDIIFELNDFGVGWDINSSLTGKAYDHKVASGGHSEEAVFLMRNFDRVINKNEIDLMDITPTILDILGVKYDKNNFDGCSIFEKPKSEI